MRALLPILLSFPLIAPAPAAARQSESPALLPTPAEMAAGEGELLLENGFQILQRGDGLAAHSTVLAEELERLTGMHHSPRSENDGPTAFRGATITLQVMTQENSPTDVAELASEAYELAISPSGVTVTAGSIQGIAWGTSTLLQCLEIPDEGPARLPALVVRDAPLAAYRSLMIDVAREPHSIDVLKGAIRLARLYKIRFLQLHLTDDQHFTFPFRPVTDKLKGNAHYRRQDLVELVAYADARGVTLVPEIDLPGHSRRLIESGYLEGAANHADVANERYAKELVRLIDDVLAVFSSSPYFHIGGDESGAGGALVPFLARVNRHVRSSGRRMIVWEGFHGAPTTELPPRGKERILVASWESSYNAPWDLLGAGYELINASWRPLYVVGGGSRIHPGSSAGRRWSPAELGEWNKDRFMHWEPGRPVFEDAGPDDSNRDDGVWDVPKASWRSQILGGQISVWEQRESSVLRDLRHRLPMLGERLWAGSRTPTPALLIRAENVDARLYGLVQPVEIRFESTLTGPMNRVATHYAGESVDVSFRNLTVTPGDIRWSIEPMRSDWNWIDYSAPKAPATSDERGKTSVEGAASIRAALFAPSGEQIGAESWARCVHWPQRVRVTNYDVGRRATKSPQEAEFPDFDSLPPSAVTGSHSMPMIRGPFDHVARRGQRHEAELVAPASGTFAIGMKTQSGNARLWLDLDRDGSFDASERLIDRTPNTEERILVEVNLEAGQHYRLRVDHVTALPRPVLIVTLDRPGVERPKEISSFLATH